MIKPMPGHSSQKLSSLVVAGSLFAALSLSACKEETLTSNFIDRAAFRYLGGTVFSRPKQVTMKEVHLDKGVLLGQEVLVEGEVVEVGRFQTYVVMSDKTARMLVVLTGMDVMDLFKEDSIKGEKIRILGVIDYGKKGLPYVLAKSIVVQKNTAS